MKRVAVGTAAIAAVLLFSIYVFLSRPTPPRALTQELTQSGCCIAAPHSILPGQLFDVVVSPPRGGPVRLHMLRFKRNGSLLFHSWAEFEGGAPELSTRTARSRQGTYIGADPNGLLWSAHPLLGDHSAVWSRLNSLPDLPKRGLVLVLEQANKVIDTRAVVAMTPADMGVRVIRTTAPFEGYIAMPAKGENSPIALLLGGSDDFSHLSTATNLAQYGITVFTFRYIRALGKSTCFEEVDLSKFDELADWLLQKLGRRGSQIAIVGVSSGAQAALILANARRPWLSGFVAIVPNRWFFNGATGPFCAFPASPWLVNQQRVPYLMNFPPSLIGLVDAAAVRLGLSNQRMTVDAALEAAGEVERRKHELDVSQVDVPGLLFGSDADEIIPSGESVRLLCSGMGVASRATVDCRTFPSAGHYISSWPGRVEPCADWMEADARNAAVVRCHATMKAAGAVWEQTVDFLRKH